MIELAVRARDDVFIRNRKGKMAHETAGKDGRNPRVLAVMKVNFPC